jgi:hypothetical protein
MIRAVLALMLIITPALSHDHWINHGKYLDPVTGLHCCDQHDCKPLTEAAIETVTRGPDGAMSVEGVTFRKGQQHKSEDGRWYRCASRCVFTPVDG